MQVATVLTVLENDKVGTKLQRKKHLPQVREHSVGAGVTLATVHSVALHCETIVKAVTTCHSSGFGVLIECRPAGLELIHFAIGNREVRDDLHQMRKAQSIFFYSDAFTHLTLTQTKEPCDTNPSLAVFRSCSAVTSDIHLHSIPNPSRS